jgi:hypothetical protein
MKARRWWHMPIFLATQEVDRDQKDHGSKPSLASSPRDTILEKKLGLVEWLKVKFRPQYRQKKIDIISIFQRGKEAQSLSNVFNIIQLVKSGTRKDT